mmetsp:Transcript_5468/g.15671  ORF Transcript_5468/g.15671 Transcript_5468/m.15671 type:complete len:201 (+) Transcript_5468:1615-2217(+)
MSFSKLLRVCTISFRIRSASALMASFSLVHCLASSRDRCCAWKFLCKVSCFCFCASRVRAFMFMMFLVVVLSDSVEPSWFFKISTSSLKLTYSAFTLTWSRRILSNCRPRVVICSSNFLVSSSAFSYALFLSFIFSSFNFFLCWLSAYSSLSLSSWLSRDFMLFTDSSHCSISFRLSSWSCLYNSAVLSISICFACVSVT